MTEIRQAFVDDLLEPHFEAYVSDFKATGLLDRRDAMKETVAEEAGTGMGGISPTGGLALYALVRELEPAVTIETGVLNGWSSLVLLTAMDAVDDVDALGPLLFSIDEPAYPGDDRDDTGARLPPDREPGWCVPDRLTPRWSLTLGRSQRELPAMLPLALPTTEVGEVDLFVLDGEHTHPAVMFELELTYEFLEPGGVIVVDDIGDHDAFDVFVAEREPEYGRITDTIGYIKG